MTFTNAKVIGDNLTHDQYAAQDAKRGDKAYRVSRSDLIDVLSCPYKWRESADEEKKSTPAMIWGALIDCMILTPKELPRLFAVCPETYTGAKGEEKPWSWAANFCKDWREEHEGMTCIKADVMESAAEAVAKIKADPAAALLLADFRPQVALHGDWADADTGLVIPVRALLDIVPGRESKHGNKLADLKTTTDASEKAWGRKVFGGLHAQAAMYVDLWNAATDEGRSSFLHLVQESKAPFALGLPALEEGYLTLGRVVYQSALKKYAQCLATDTWPSYYPDGWRVLEPEPWMFLTGGIPVTPTWAEEGNTAQEGAAP